MQQTLTVTTTFVIASLLNVTTLTVPGGVIGQPYSFQMAAAGGTPPYTWTATGLPTGLSMSSAGLVSGTPSAVGSFNASITVKDSGQ